MGKGKKIIVILWQDLIKSFLELNGDFNGELFLRIFQWQKLLKLNLNFWKPIFYVTKLFEINDELNDWFNNKKLLKFDCNSLEAFSFFKEKALLFWKTFQLVENFIRVWNMFVHFV